MQKKLDKLSSTSLLCISVVIYGFTFMFDNLGFKIIALALYIYIYRMILNIFINRDIERKEYEKSRDK